MKGRAGLIQHVPVTIVFPNNVKQVIQWSFSKLHPDVDDSGPHRLVDEYNSNYVLVLNVAKATAGVMENPARDLVI